MADRETSHDARTDRALERTFERKVWRAKLSLIFEQVWRRAWVLLLIAGLFTLVSLLGLWPHLPPLAHKIVLAAFAVAAGFAALGLFVIRWPTRSDAIRRIEQVSNIPHRPASSYEDTLAAEADDPETQALWKAHRARLAALFQRLRVGTPRPRVDRYDPFALRALMILLIATVLGFVGISSFDRIKTAFQLAGDTNLASVRLDAWVSPPTYTARPPVMLSDGGTPVVQAAVERGTAVDSLTPVVVPRSSTLVVRIAGLGATKANVTIFSSESFEDESKAHVITPEKSLTGSDVQEFRSKITEETMVRVATKDGALERWYISVIPDALPTIKLIGKPLRTPRGSMKLAYEVKDDYGVSGAVAHFEDAEHAARAPTIDSRLQLPTLAPRSKKRQPLDMTLRLPGPQNKDGKAQTYLDFAPSPWAGRRVIMSLKAKDVAGQTGVSPGIEIILPERKFTKPLAQAVIEQRRKLFDNPRARRREVALALRALTTDPQEFFEDTRIYLNLRSVFHRLQRSGTPNDIKQSIDQLWHTALRIEEGDLSDAERRVRDAQDKLAKALEEGASEEEIKKLMQELRQAMNDFMNQMAKENQNQRDFTQGNDQDNQSVNQNDINEMMRNIEEMAKSGAREEAQKMLSQMRDMMERMQRGGQQNQQQARQQQKQMNAIRKLGGMVGKQQKLMDDTFTKQHRGQGNMPGKRAGQQKAPGQFGPQGQQGQPRSGRSNQQGMALGQQQNQYGQGQQRGQRGQRGQGGQQGQSGGGQQPSAQELAARQKQLRDQLEALQKQLSEQGIGQPEQLENARQAMQNAEQALKNQNLSRATEEQARALSNMQQGTKSMAEDMMSNSPQRFGDKGKERRDPLGRPQRSSGPELGTSVKVPQQIELQRAREIIDELRRRRGEVTRPTIELDYLDRLLRRF